MPGFKLSFSFFFSPCLHRSSFQANAARHYLSRTNDRFIVAVSYAVPPLMIAIPLSSSVVFQRTAAGSSTIDTQWLIESVGWLAIAWYLLVVFVCALGYVQM